MRGDTALEKGEKGTFCKEIANNRAGLELKPDIKSLQFVDNDIN